MNPDGTVSSSEDAPDCSVEGCTQSAIPGNAVCGVHQEDGTPPTDGTPAASVGNVTGVGAQDGTGRSAAPSTPEERASASLSFGDQETNVYNALCASLSSAGGYVDIWVVDLGPDWVVWAAYGSDTTYWQQSYSIGDLDGDGDTDVTFSGSPQEVSITVKTSYEPVDRAEVSDEETRDAPKEETSIEPESADAKPIEVEDVPAEPDDEERAAKKPSGRADHRWKPRHRSAPDPRQEIRLRVSDLEIRSSSTSDDIILEGTPIVYNSAYDVHDMFGTFHETMSERVCDHVLASPQQLDCRFLFNHDGLPLSRTQSGTLELENGRGGLRSIAHLDGRQSLANDLAIAVERGDVSQMSCGFIVAEDEWDDDYLNRTINSFGQLLDVSAVTYPASPTTTIDIAQRSMFSMPTESRARIREAFKVVNEVRAGKVLSTANAQLIMQALESLHQADDADPAELSSRAQTIAEAHGNAIDALSQVVGVDGAPASSTSAAGTVTDPGPPVRSEPTEDEQRASELRRKAIVARRNQLARKRFMR